MSKLLGTLESTKEIKMLDMSGERIFSDLIIFLRSGTEWEMFYHRTRTSS